MTTERPSADTVLIVDSLPLRRMGLAALLGDWLDRNALAVATTAPEAGALPQTEGPYALIIFSLGGQPLRGEALELSRRLAVEEPTTPRVVIADTEELQVVLAAFKDGARGYISTRAEPDVAKQALSFILAGGSYFPPSSLMALPASDGMGHGGRPTSGGAHGLTARQIDVLLCIHQGLSNKMIARALDMQESTVKVHVRQILRKLGAENRTQAALAASEIAELMTGRAPTTTGPSPNGRTVVRSEPV